MAIALDHTIVPARDKQVSAEFFARIFGLDPPAPAVAGPFVAVRVNEILTLDFDDQPDAPPQHYAFRVSESDFDAIFGRIRAEGITYGSGPFSARDGQINRRNGGRGIYFTDPGGHLLELLTRPYA